jgi:hypothetical protein
VYSYNFPNDRPSLKYLGEYRRSSHGLNQVTRQTLYLVYFTFLLETAQTALTGADIYYWFIEGYGDMERLSNSYLSPIDVPIFHGIIALVVQGYFCYRIWSLNSRSLKLCIVIALVRMNLPLYLDALTTDYALSLQ